MYQYWKTNELCHSGVKGMKWGIRKKRESKWGIRKKREPITSKNMGREEREYRNRLRRTKRLATAAALTDLAARASLIAFSKIPESSSGFKTAAALLGVTGRLAGGYLGGKASTSGLFTIAAHKKYANTLSGKERKKENAKIVRNTALAAGVVGAQYAGHYARNYARKLGQAKFNAAASSAGAAARNVVDNVANTASRIWMNATARPYGSVKVQKATKTGYDVMKALLPSGQRTLSFRS